MNFLYRMLDANINRASEGLRVVEDVVRFKLNQRDFTESLKRLRHEIRQEAAGFEASCEANFVLSRDSLGDVGCSISQTTKLDTRLVLSDLISSNFKRAQEALRVIEETFKLLGEYQLAKRYELLRFQTYQLEKEWYTGTQVLAKTEKLKTDIYGITDHPHSCGRDSVEIVTRMIEAGIKIIQYREKDKELAVKFEECRRIRELTQNAGVTFIVNDHIDLALLVGADGVHIGQDDLPLEAVRSLVGAKMIIGVSTHSPAQAEKAVKDGADYIGVGPLFTTQTKKNVCAPVGLEYLEYAAKNVSVPFVAIGGIKEQNLAQVLARGAKCIALVSEIVSAEDITEKVKTLRQIIKEEGKR